MISMKLAVEQELNLKGKDFLTLADFTPEEILGLLDNAKKLKRSSISGEAYHSFKREKSWNDF